MRRSPAGSAAVVGRHVARLGAALLCVLGVITLGAPEVLAAPTAAHIATATSGSGDATISGTVLLGATKAPAPGVALTLHGTTTGTESVTLTTVSAADGTFAFPALDGGTAWTYTVTAPYDGVFFSSDIVVVEPNATASLTLSLYDTTPSPATVTMPIWMVWVDVTGATMAVQQDVAITNGGKAAYAGSDPVTGVPGNDHAAVTLPLAPGASNLEYLGRFEVCCGAVSGSSWSHTRPISPGDSTGTLRYEAPFVSTLTFPVRFATGAFTLLVPEGTSVSSPQLTQQPGTSTDRGITYVTYKSAALAVGAVVTVTLTPAATGPSWVLWAVVIGLLALIAAVIAIVVVRRRNAAATPPAPTRGPGKKSAPKGSGPARPSGHKPQDTKRAKPDARTPAAPKAKPTTAAAKKSGSTSATEHPDVLADELAMLDLAFESGALPDEASYRRVRESLVERLVVAVGDDPAALESATERP